MATLTVLATSTTDSTFGGGTTNAANAYTNASSTNYAQYNITTGTAGKAEELYLTGYDFSSIPSNATINSVTIKIKTQINSTTYITTSTCQAYSGTTAKGSTTSLQNTAAAQYTLSSGTWTRSELDNLRLRFYAKRSSGNNNRSRAAYVRIYGTEVIVDWTPADGQPQLMFKQSGTWAGVSKVFKKVNNTWVEQTDLESLFDIDAKYMKGD